jgi:hypothetical protein
LEQVLAGESSQTDTFIVARLVPPLNSVTSAFFLRDIYADAAQGDVLSNMHQGTR